MHVMLQIVLMSEVYKLTSVSLYEKVETIRWIYVAYSPECDGKKENKYKKNSHKTIEGRNAVI